MDTQSILSELHEERDRLDQAIAALEGSSPRRRGPGRPASVFTSSLGVRGGQRKRRPLSPATKKRISEMMKQAWAERKKAAGKAGKAAKEA